MKSNSTPLYDTIELAAMAASQAEPNRHRSIFRDPETDKYWYDGCTKYSVISIGRSESYTHERCAVTGPGVSGWYELCEPSVLPGDYVFHAGSVAKVVDVNRRCLMHDTHYICWNGKRMPTFKKEMREKGYAIIREDKAERLCVARKVESNG
jgi:hypothetical protein